MTNKEILKQYHIFVSHPREITVWEDLKIDITIKLTDEEFELMKMQQLQVNESIMLPTWWAKTISYTHMIEHIIIEETDKPIMEQKIHVNAWDESDKEVLKKWMEQLLNQTEKHILKSKNVEDLLEK
jgi:hypothetical protein